MKVINLLISLFGIIKTNALECVSVVNQKCMPIPKIYDKVEFFRTYKMKVINLLISLFGIIKTNPLECVCQLLIKNACLYLKYLT